MGDLVKRLKLTHRGDERGRLSVAQYADTLPFIVRRAYWIHGTAPGVSRGFHAHKRLHQVMVCLAGAVDLTVSDGVTEEKIRLEAFGDPVLIGPGLWRVMSDFTPDCILMVFADQTYDEADYIRDKEEFAAHARKA
jgi:dTDP-4-dehydrorhamnose 3,5-epimerase